MNTFADEFNKKENMTYTANHCLTNKSSFNKNLDFFAQASAMRGMDSDVVDLFRMCYNEDANLAIKNLFYLRDVRGGAGERDLFRSCLRYLTNRVSIGVFAKIISYIPEYGRWDDLLDVLKYMHETQEAEILKCKRSKTKPTVNYKGMINVCLKLIFQQIKDDIKNCTENKKISLLTKWFPIANNRHTPEGKMFAKWLCKQFFGNEADCRKVIVTLRKHAQVLEQKLSANEWDKVDYSKIPSCANLKYRRAFNRHDGERYAQYIKDATVGKVNMNSGTLYPYQIVKGIVDQWYSTRSTPRCINDPQTVQPLEAMWKNLPNYINHDSSAIAVIDTSGSMTWGNQNKTLPIEVAMSLGIYFAERNTGPFKDMFFTFSGEPKCIKLQGETLAEKISSINMSNAGFNTDIYKTFKLYLDLAKKSKPEDCPKNVIIISDMEFDEASCSENTAFEEIDKMFSEAAIERPNLIFWNVNASGHNIPVRYDEYGTAMISGSSPSAFKFVTERKTPIEMMLEVLNSDRYKNIEI